MRARNSRGNSENSMLVAISKPVELVTTRPQERQSIPGEAADALSCAIAFRASGPCALQSSAFKTADLALDHFSTPGRTRSPDGWSRACRCQARSRDGAWRTKLARTRVHARKGGQSWSLAMSEDGQALRVVRCKFSTPHPAYRTLPSTRRHS